MKSKIIFIVILLLILPSACLAQNKSNAQDHFQKMVYDIEVTKQQKIEIYNKSKIPFLALEFQTVSDFQSAKFEVESFNTKPEQLPKPPYEFIYKYVEVISDLDDYVLESAEVEFRVKNSWISRNEVNRKAVKLLRLQGNSWQAFSAEQFNKDANHTYYTSKIPGFSYFAIVGRTTETAEALARQQELAITPPVNESQPETSEEESSKIYYIVIIVVITAVILGIIFYIIRKRRNQPVAELPEQRYRYSHEFFQKR